MADNITDDSFEKEVLKSTIPVLVDFWAEWCGPCRMLTPTIEELSKDEELKGKIKIVKVDIDNNAETPSKYGIRSIPTMMIFENGKAVETKVGVLTKDKIKEWISSSVGI
ncbi:MAG: thioredoxin [Rickettsia endosymbiont of Bryobia graminum]|nr:thioredoxin [Rickettsia endosymbiont of Bryobia graminum]